MIPQTEKRERCKSCRYHLKRLKPADVPIDTTMKLYKDSLFNWIKVSAGLCDTCKKAGLWSSNGAVDDVKDMNLHENATSAVQHLLLMKKIKAEAQLGLE